MKENIYTAYSAETDMTFILKEVIEEEILKSVEVIGFYYGQPNEEMTELFSGDLKMEL